MKNHKQSIFDKYNNLIGSEYGFLKLREVKTSKSSSNRISCSLVFECRCGVNKEYSISQASKILRKESVSCGCVKKDKWRKSYYAWKNSNDNIKV